MGFLLGKNNKGLYKNSAEKLLKVVAKICYNIFKLYFNEWQC
jgi:hypothetical protein